MLICILSITLFLKVSIFHIILFKEYYLISLIVIVIYKINIKIYRIKFTQLVLLICIQNISDSLILMKRNMKKIYKRHILIILYTMLFSLPLLIIMYEAKVNMFVILCIK